MDNPRRYYLPGNREQWSKGPLNHLLSTEKQCGEPRHRDPLPKDIRGQLLAAGSKPGRIRYEFTDDRAGFSAVLPLSSHPSTELPAGRLQIGPDGAVSLPIGTTP